MKFYQSGRSMVEMLGVLAIIGVLSVGAIAGYSKAMMKYKLNKQAEQISTLLNNALFYAGEFQVQSSASIVPYLIKLNAVPKEMIYGTTTAPALYDALHTRIGITWSKSTSMSVYNMAISMTDSDNGMDGCRNIINTILGVGLFYLKYYIFYRYFSAALKTMHRIIPASFAY